MGAVPIFPRINANYAHASGLLELSYEEREEKIETYSETAAGEVTYKQTMERELNWKTEWGVSTVGAGAVVSKKLLFFTPFAGIGISKDMGDVDSNLGAEGEITLEPVGGGSTQTESLDITGAGTDPAKDINIRLIGGFELSFLMVKLGIAGEVAGTDKFAVNAGLRLQF